MKKLLIILASFISILHFALFVDGRYQAFSKSNNFQYDMTIIVKNNKISSMSFDKKTEDGKTLKLTDQEFQQKTINISTKVRRENTLNVNELEFDSQTNAEFKKLYDYLVNKMENGETGNFKIK